MFSALISIDMNALTGNVASSGGNPVRNDIPVEDDRSVNIDRVLKILIC
jgi:hypothetical protein